MCLQGRPILRYTLVNVVHEGRLIVRIYMRDTLKLIRKILFRQVEQQVVPLPHFS